MKKLFNKIDEKAIFQTWNREQHFKRSMIFIFKSRSIINLQIWTKFSSP